MIDVLASAKMVRDVARLHAVAATGLGPRRQRWCDEVVDRVRQLLRVPVALLVLVERSRQVLPGAAGLPEPWQQRRETPLTHSVCQYVVGSGAALTITDARRDPVLHTSDAIRDLGVVAYAGVPVRDRTGHVLGALCAIDTRPRPWTEREISTLRHIAAECLPRLRNSTRSTSAPPANKTRPAATPPATRPYRDDTLWTPIGAPHGLALGSEPPVRDTATGLAMPGRWHDEPVTVIVQTIDDPRAQRRFRRRIQVAQALQHGNLPIPVEEHRWHNHRTLIVSRPAGKPLLRRPGRIGRHSTGEWTAVIHLAALLSAWQPTPADRLQWTIDYPAWIARHQQAGHLCADESARLQTLLDRCDVDRTFAHGNLVPRTIIRQPSQQLALTGFTHSGMYLAGRDLVTLAFAAPDACHQRALMQRVVDADIVEPFTVNLLLAAADLAAHRPATPADWLATVMRARRCAHHLLTRLGA
ncbi:GAF domain-containing protein [Dactylosporangium sp. CS-047395]|uniref:GAF domain-containing protein n=1 Tax=Dactylosporangium sp. CS-047395 TaxID=3239936 RepID=UPI003D8F7C7D